jgi:protoporphyrinogen oxidase
MNAQFDALVLGGGAAGMGAADALVRSGLSVGLVEAGPALGGLARSVTIGGEPIEAYYHHIFPQDAETIALTRRLGLADRLEWRHGPMAVLDGNHLHPFDGPLDILRFPPLRLDERLRLAAASALQVPRLRFARGIHRDPVGAGGPRWFGRHAYDTVWRPLLEAKFGPHAADVSMAWLAARIRQRAGARRSTGDQLGYLRGSLGTLLRAFGEDLQRSGVDVRTSTRVSSIVRESDGNGDGWTVEVEGPDGPERLTARSVVAALSGGILDRLVELPPAYRDAVRAIPYRGIVCALVELERPLTDRYWINVTGRLGLGCVAIIEHTNFVPAAWYGGSSVVYLAHYVGRDDPAWTASDTDLVASVDDTFRRLNPDWSPSWIRSIVVSRDPFAQPVPLVSGPMPSLPIETGLPGLVHLSLAHVYPDDRGVSMALRLGARGAAAVRRHLAVAP